MGEAEPGRGIASLLLLRRTRALLRTTPGRLLFASVVVGYLWLSMSVGQMLVLGRTGATSTTVAIFLSGYPSWNYPQLVVIAPNAVLALPYLSTLTMAIVALGVGLGMSASAVLVVRIVKGRRAGGTAAGVLGGVEGLTPAMIAAVTLGACCSTTAASTAGIGLAAQASGTTVTNLLANSWFLNLLQVLVLGVALLAQEQLIEVYGRVLGVLPSTDSSSGERAHAPTARTVGTGMVRALLVGAGVAWSLSMFVAWTQVDPTRAGVGSWFEWLVVYQAIAILAVGAGLFPTGFARVLTTSGQWGAGRFARL
ncbi:MAG: hypothetical protein L3J72_03655, partial [Thermoplasmata archaeon]|nr:hypothetical protein [Thermoplasmata archaeon]